MQAYGSARSRAQLVDVLLAAQIALYTLRFAGAAYVALVPDGGLAITLARGERLSQPFLLLLLFVATTIAFLLWLHRAARNLPALGARAPISARLAVGIFFAPAINLAGIPYVVRQVWHASDPTPPARRWLLMWWWVALLEGVLALGTPLLSAPMFVASALCLVAIVRDAQRRQDEQFLDDELRRAVPLPAVDALR